MNFYECLYDRLTGALFWDSQPVAQQNSLGPLGIFYSEALSQLMFHNKINDRNTLDDGTEESTNNKQWVLLLRPGPGPESWSWVLLLGPGSSNSGMPFEMFFPTISLKTQNSKVRFSLTVTFLRHRWRHNHWFARMFPSLKMTTHHQRVQNYFKYFGYPVC